MQVQDLRVVQGPHNGKPRWQFPDPVTGQMIGGQVAYIRTALRRKRFVGPWGRRAGKTTTRPFLWVNEAAMTAGRYTAGFITANHTKAWEMLQFCRSQFGDMVEDVVGEPESQNRYIDTKPIVGRMSDVPRAFRDCPVIGPRVAANLGRNTGMRVYFWSGQHPHYQAIQGFPFKFHRISPDECQQLHRGVTRIITPMLLDSGGSADFTGIADVDAIGNDWFQTYYEKGLDPKNQHRWASLNFPTYCNPSLDDEALAEVVGDLLTSDDYEQYILAKFISGSGAVFKNLERIFVLAPRWRREKGSESDMPTWFNLLMSKAPSDLVQAWIVDERAVVGHQYALSVDFAGRTRMRDATVIDVFDLTENRQVALIVIRDMDSPDQLHWVDGVKTAYGATELHGDETPEGAALMGFLRRRHGAGIRGHNFSSANKANYVKKGQFLFEMAEVQLINCDYQRQEFKDFRRITSESKDGKDGPVSYSHPPGKHDDTVAAFLQIAPSMGYGRREIEVAAPELDPLVDKAGTTTLELWARDCGIDRLPPTREEGEAAGFSWDSVVLT